MAVDLPLIWALIIAFAVLAYVVLDGFDLGIGILFPMLATKEDRDVAMNSVAPVWDGNETWLVLGGGGLFAAFPLAYAVLMPALYAPVIAMLLGLILRGVAFEFRWRTETGKFIWDGAFFAGSLMAALAQGIMLGAIVQGIQVEGRGYGGGWFDWVSPFSLATGVAVAIGYAMLGSSWLIWRTVGDLQVKAFALAKPAAVMLIACIGLISFWTLFLNPMYPRRWFSWPAIMLTMPLPALTLFVVWRLWRALERRHEVEPFVSTLLVFALCYFGLGISLYPYIVPASITIWDAASPDSSLYFLLVGAMILLPMILAYTAYSYWVFRGKVTVADGYH